MNGDDIDDWSDKHIGSLGLMRTVIGFVNLIIGLVIMSKLFGWLG